MRYRLRTLMILLAFGPPALAWGWSEYAKCRERERLREVFAPLLSGVECVLVNEDFPGDAED